VAGVLSGWSQGDFVPLAAHSDLHLPNDASVRAIITPYSCVMAQAEPATLIDLLVVRPANEDAGYFFGKSTRKINLCAVVDGAERHFDATPDDRRSIEAQQLIPHKPDRSLRLVDAHREGLSYWMAQRYLRAALPDDFNAAWDPARKGLRKLAKRMSGCGIVLLMQRQTAAKTYAVELVLVLAPRESDKLGELQVVATEMEKLFLGCDRIESVEIDVRSADAVSLRDFQEWSHFDAFDDLSMASGHAGPANHARGALENLSKPAPFRQRLRWAWIILRGTHR